MSNVTATTQPKTFKELIKLESYQRELGKALPKGVTPERIEKIIIFFAVCGEYLTILVTKKLVI